MDATYGDLALVKDLGPWLSTFFGDDDGVGHEPLASLRTSRSRFRRPTISKTAPTVAQVLL
jgi:hypothetical protein